MEVWTTDGCVFLGVGEETVWSAVDELPEILLQAAQRNGVAASEGACAVVLTGTFLGRVRLEVHDGPPGDLPVDPRDDVVELPLEVAVGGPLWCGSDGEGGPAEIGAVPGGRHRLRVQVVGRDDAAAHEEDDLRERLVLHLWPAAPAPLAVVQLGSEQGRAAAAALPTPLGDEDEVRYADETPLPGVGGPTAGLELDGRLTCPHCGQARLLVHGLQVVDRPPAYEPDSWRIDMAVTAMQRVPVPQAGPQPSADGSWVLLDLWCDACTGTCRLQLAEVDGGLRLGGVQGTVGA